MLSPSWCFSAFRKPIPLIFMALVAVFPGHLRAEDLFPEYDCIKPNVAFWKKVYAEYPNTKALVHDKSNVAIIYEVIDLLHEDEPNASEINKSLRASAENKYRLILDSLGAGNPPADDEERRVAALFGRNAQPFDFQKARDNVRIQRCMRERFQAGIIRSGLYLDEIKRIMRSYGLPEDLAYLPHVESSFNYEAYSKAGASGVWQFTESTGKRFMNINDEIDERRDPILATHAAARYLRANYEKIGNWPLTLTSYNHGEAGVLRALDQYGSYEQIFLNHDAGSFRFASRNFYPEFVAAREVAMNYQKYFGDIPIERPLETRSVELTGYAGFNELADHFRVQPEILKGLNPAILEPVLEGKRMVPPGYVLRLPATTSEERLAANPSHLLRSSQIIDRPRVVSNFKGKEVKKSKNSKPQEVVKQIAANLNNEANKNKKEPQRRVNAAVPQEKSVVVLKEAGKKVITVQKGETVASLAARHGVNVSTLMAANGLRSSAVIKPGKKLVLPVDDKRTDTQRDKTGRVTSGGRS